MLKSIKQRLNKISRNLKDATQVGVTSVFILSQLFIPFLAAQPVRADGNDSPTECLGTTVGVVASIGGEDAGESGELVEYDAGSDNIVDGVCIKSGDDAFGDKQHSEVLDNGKYENDCYEVTGIGTREVKVERIGDGPDCKEISHIDVVVVEDGTETGSISGFKFNDLNDNAEDDDEPRLEDWTFELKLDTDKDGDFDDETVLDTDVTDINGEFSFSGLEEGKYQICEVQQAGWERTFPVSSDCRTRTLDTGEDETGLEFGNKQIVDYCDPSQKPGGMDIAEWLAENQVDGSDCFEINPIPECGAFDVEFTKNLTPYEYSFRYVLGDTTPTVENWEGDGTLPVEFDEDEGNGSVEITYYIVGPEKDYFTGFDMPNIWDGNGVTVEVETDCEPPVDFCNPSQKPGGMSIAEWLESNEVNGADCFDYEIVQRCGYLDITLTEYPNKDNGWVYEAVYTTDGSVVLPKNAETFPAIFDEEENSGSVDVTWYIVGPEGDYLEGFDLPNYWDGEGETIEVDTDCEPDVTVIKYHDLNQNGEFDEGEPKLPDWKFFLDKCELELSALSLDSLESQGIYGDCLFLPLLNREQTNHTTIQSFNSDYCYGGHDHCEKTDENGEAEFKDLDSFTLYRLSEKLKNGWIQSSIDCDYINEGNQDAEGVPISYNGHLIFVAPNSEVTCEVGNYRQAELDIAKSNDATNALLPGQTANFTITVTNPEDSGILHDVKAYDLMPEGLSYVNGSAEIDGVPAAPEPDYTTDSSAVWELGDMNPGDVRVLTYTAVVDEDTAPGTYTNVAWTDGCEEVSALYRNGVVEIEEPRCGETEGQVLGNVDRECFEEEKIEYFSQYGEKDEEPEEDLNCDPFVESEVTVAAVLGETETKVLAVTGVPAVLLPAIGLAIMAIAIGAAVPNRKWRRMFGKFAQFSRSAAMGFMALILSVGMTAGVSAQGNFWRLTVNDMDTQTNVESVEVGWQINTTNDSDEFEIALTSDGPGDNDITTPLTATAEGSERGTFTLPVPEDGDYDVTITATTDNASSTDVSDTNPHEQTITRDTVEGETVVVVQDDSNGQTAGSTTGDDGVVSDAAATDSQQADDEEGQEQAATDEAADGENGEEEDGDNSGVIVTVIVLAGLAALLYNYFVRAPNESSN